MASRRVQPSRRTTNSKTPTSTASKSDPIIEEVEDVNENAAVESDDTDDTAAVEDADATQTDEDTDQVESVVQVEETPAVGVTRASSWKSDQYGNPTDDQVAMPPRGLVPEREFFPFEYVAGERSGTIVASEDVYGKINYPGSERKGRTLAYNRGTILHESILDVVSD